MRCAGFLFVVALVSAGCLRPVVEQRDAGRSPGCAATLEPSTGLELAPVVFGTCCGDGGTTLVSGPPSYVSALEAGEELWFTVPGPTLDFSRGAPPAPESGPTLWRTGPWLQPYAIEKVSASEDPLASASLVAIGSKRYAVISSFYGRRLNLLPLDDEGSFVRADGGVPLQLPAGTQSSYYRLPVVVGDQAFFLGVDQGSLTTAAKVTLLDFDTDAGARVYERTLTDEDGGQLPVDWTYADPCQLAGDGGTLELVCLEDQGLAVRAFDVNAAPAGEPTVLPVPRDLTFFTVKTGADGRAWLVADETCGADAGCGPDGRAVVVKDLFGRRLVTTVDRWLPSRVFPSRSGLTFLWSEAQADGGYQLSLRDLQGRSLTVASGVVHQEDAYALPLANGDFFLAAPFGDPSHPHHFAARVCGLP